MVFYIFQVWLFWLFFMIGVRVVIEIMVGVVVVCGVRIGVGVGSAENRGESVVSSGGNVSVAGGGARWRDCCRFHDGIFRKLWEYLPYHLSFTVEFGDVFL